LELIGPLRIFQELGGQPRRPFQPDGGNIVLKVCPGAFRLHTNHGSRSRLGSGDARQSETGQRNQRRSCSVFCLLSWLLAAASHEERLDGQDAGKLASFRPALFAKIANIPRVLAASKSFPYLFPPARIFKESSNSF
jgi:hypothetical protein